jgi:hypothetical protein
LLQKAEADELHELLAQQARIQFSAHRGERGPGLGSTAFQHSLASSATLAWAGHVETLLEHKLPYTPPVSPDPRPVPKR